MAKLYHNIVMFFAITTSPSPQRQMAKQICLIDSHCNRLRAMDGGEWALSECHLCKTSSVVSDPEPKAPSVVILDNLLCVSGSEEPSHQTLHHTCIQTHFRLRFH